MGCCRWGWLVRQGDTTEEAHIKTTVFPFALCILIIWMVILVRQLQSNNQMIYVVGNAINAFAMILFMGGAIINAIPAGYLLDVLLVLCTLGISAMDLGEATTSYPYHYLIPLAWLDRYGAVAGLCPRLQTIPHARLYYPVCARVPGRFAGGVCFKVRTVRAGVLGDC
eukprot:Hpha_TRINITY_DN16308_c2_g5::TRINITY_DN16308_c2_g5_i1::g.58726::m.58726